MPRTREFDAEQVLTSAMGVFWDRGYEATSIGDLTQVTGLSRSSLYAAYGSKRGLFESVLDRYLAGLDSMLSPLENGTRGLADIVAFYEGWRTQLQTSDGSLGCLMVNTIAERGHVDPAIVQAGQNYLNRLHTAFLRALTVAGSTGEVQAEATDGLAQVLVLITTGLFIASRGQPDERIRELIDSTITQIETWRTA